ncbi:hypothetical protein DFH07DRAFT_406289 [Mycena maculata]|uniref:Uncharacterized protein n=1 Tax=Mycena maculata TaxID=230809 RepID=A0AAD7H580_9AGAR|nr:hypothetical protein DFH07DRAFT_406289 [Mycena maculata]
MRMRIRFPSLTIVAACHRCFTAFWPPSPRDLLQELANRPDCVLNLKAEGSPYLAAKNATSCRVVGVLVIGRWIARVPFSRLHANSKTKQPQ